MSEVEIATQKLWDGDQAIAQGRFGEAFELLEWVVCNPPSGLHQYMAAHASVRAYAKYSDETGDKAPLTPGTVENQKMRLYMDLVIDMFPEMPPDIQKGMPIDNTLALKKVFENWGAPTKSSPQISPAKASQPKINANAPSVRQRDNFSGSIAGSIRGMIGISFVLWLIVGTGACLNRFVNVPFGPEDAGYGNSRLFKYIFGAYLSEGLVAVGLVFAVGTVVLFVRYLLSIKTGKKSIGAKTAIVGGLGTLVIVVGVIWGLPMLRNVLSSTTSADSVPATSQSGDIVNAGRVIKADKVTSGRTAGEKVHEFVVPANQWVETELKISSNQEVMVHHFSSNDAVKVNLGGKTDTRLQNAGTILPMFTSTNCSNDSGVKAKVQYICIQLNQPESIKLYADKKTRVGVVVKNR